MRLQILFQLRVEHQEEGDAADYGTHQTVYIIPYLAMERLEFAVTLQHIPFRIAKPKEEAQANRRRSY